MLLWASEFLNVFGKVAVLCHQVFKGLLDHYGVTSFNLLAVQGQVLAILVENQGRMNYGSQIVNNRKVGITN